MNISWEGGGFDLSHIQLNYFGRRRTSIAEQNMCVTYFVKTAFVIQVQVAVVETPTVSKEFAAIERAFFQKELC